MKTLQELEKEKTKLTEALIKTKYECYQAYLKSLDDEFLKYEFNDRMGADPENYYGYALHHENQGHWIATLEDWCANALYEDPLFHPINMEYKEACK